MKDIKVTIYKTLYAEEAYHLPLSSVLDRIKTGSKSGDIMNQIRFEPDKSKQDELKKKLPCIVFAGLLPNGKREDNRITNHTNLAILDFDNLTLEQLTKYREKFIATSFTVACFLSPRANGLKVLVHIKDGLKHREYYQALLHEYPDLDRVNINPSRVCFESYDPDIYINYNATKYSKILEHKTVDIYVPKNVAEDDTEKFKKLSLWMQNRNETFASGSRNIYIHKLAGACCRFGIDEFTTKELLHAEYLSKDSDFTVSEMNKSVQSAFRRNSFNSAEFDKSGFVDKQTKTEVNIIEDTDYVSDVIYGSDVKEGALKLLRNGYESAETTGISEIDKLWKWKKGELNILTGIGNHGKSSWLAFMMLNKSAMDGTRWGIFSPESYPANEFYHSLCEMVLGTACNPFSNYIPDEDTYNIVYEWVSEHFYYIYPKELSPTPEYIKSRFLELIIKHKVSGCVIDPFNQMVNDYSVGRDDKYLESFLGDISRFALINSVYMVVVCHPHKLRKTDAGGYDAPDVFDLAGGAMWNNKADNILVYHRPNRHLDPQDPTCELHSKKIRRQSMVGSLGKHEFKYSHIQRRFIFMGYPLSQLLSHYGINFRKEDESY